MRLKKHNPRSIAPAIDVRHVVAKGGTVSGIHAKIITSVDQQRVTHIRQMLACKEFMAVIISFPRSLLYRIDPL